MTQKIDSKDLKLAYLIAEYRLLTVKQIAVLEGAHVRTVRRRMAKLFCMDYAIERKRVVRGQSGRPEFIYSLSQKGVQCLHEKGALEEEHSYEKIGWKSPVSIEHQLSVNWIQIAAQILQRNSAISIEFLSQTSPFLPPTQNGKPFIYDQVPVDGMGDMKASFIPDAVMAITNSGLGKTYLFFLEVDRSTEPLASENGNSRSIHHKFYRYQLYFHSQGYKRYERFFKAPLNGFVLLVVCNSDRRLKQIHNLAQQIPDDSFVWLTTEQRILNRGLGASIWVQDDGSLADRVSVLGRQFALEDSSILSRMKD